MIQCVAFIVCSSAVENTAAEVAGLDAAPRKSNVLVVRASVPKFRFASKHRDAKEIV